MRSNAKSTRILMLHRALDDVPVAYGLPNCYRLRGTALTLDELVRLLDEVSPVMTLDAVEQALALGEEPPPGYVLTFDDGYRDHLDCVAPLLAARSVSATFYVATGLHGRGRDVAIVDAWYWLLDHAEARVARVPMPDGDEFRGRIDTLEGKREWVTGEPKRVLLGATAVQQAGMVAALAESVACELPDDLAARLYLCREEWSTLVTLGMRVGAHSVRHLRLTDVDDGTLRVEVRSSIEAVHGLCAPVAFAYPDGAYDERVKTEVRLAKASSAVTCEPGDVRRGADVLRLPRVFVDASFRDKHHEVGPSKAAT